MYNNKYELNVAINGKPVREHYQNGKFFIEARPNSEYSIKLKNHSHKRIMAVFSVDGIDVLKGGKASEAQSGYIVNPFSHVVINGYRIDDENVATFKFSDGKQSYSTEVEYDFDFKKLKKVAEGKLAPSKNNGVIAVRVWEEKEPVVIPNWEVKSQIYTVNSNNNRIYPMTSLASGYNVTLFNISGASPAFSGCPVSTGSLGPQGNIGPMGARGVTSNYDNSSVHAYSCNVNNIYPDGQLICSNSSIPQTVSINASYPISTSSYVPNFNIGTAWGEQVIDKVVKIDFEKADGYIDLILYYLERSELINLGIDLENNKQVFISGWPEPFEKEVYCQKPVNWRHK